MRHILRKLLLVIIISTLCGMGMISYAQTSAENIVERVQSKITTQTLEQQKLIWQRLQYRLSAIVGTGADAVFKKYTIRKEISKKLRIVQQKLQSRITENLEKKVETITIPVSEIGREDPALHDLSIVSNQIFQLVNTERKNAGLSGLIFNSLLSQAAQKQAVYMAQSSDFAHTTKTGSTPADRVRAVGYPYRAVGENIASGQRNAEEVMHSRMNSEGHKANILNKDFKEIGIGYQSGYRVQVFGTRR